MEAPSPLSKMAAECIADLTRLLDECGLGRQNIAHDLWDAADQLIASQPNGRRHNNTSVSSTPTPRLFPIANQAVTEWRKDPQFSDERGHPRLLPRSGPRSMTALVRSVSRSANVSAVVRYLTQTETIQKVGTRYQLCRPWILLRGKEGPWFQLRYVHQTLGTSLNNLHPQPDTARFQRLVEHVRIPISKLPSVERHLDRRGMAVLNWFDDLLRRYAAQARTGERTIWLAVALHLLQGKGAPPSDVTGSTRGSRMTKPRKAPNKKRAAVRG
jgi:hypothetical protein